MIIKLLTRMAGPAGNYPAGSVVELPADEAAGLITGGYAMAMDPPEEQGPAPRRGKKVHK